MPKAGTGGNYVQCGPFVLRLVTESACFCRDAGISFFEFAVRWDLPMS
nr:MAG TPA: hypothetical protein [Bacteriophage sp.]